jgi:hypothetical protein
MEFIALRNMIQISCKDAFKYKYCIAGQLQLVNHFSVKEDLTPNFKESPRQKNDMMNGQRQGSRSPKQVAEPMGNEYLDTLNSNTSFQ